MRHTAFLLFLMFLLEVDRGVCAREHCTSKGCFSVVQDAVDFTSAEKHCNDYYFGHLMTIKSAKEHDVILDLLNGSSGDYWIGLKLPDGKCPDRETQLRGYEWVTGGSDTDFVNWEEVDHSCVSVSAGRNSTWRQRSCGVKLQGALCMYSFDGNACNALPENAEHPVRYFTPRGSVVAVGSERFPPGSTAIQKPLDVKNLCFSGKWLRAPWACEVMNGGCEHDCVPPGEVPSCTCPTGQSLRADNVTCGSDSGCSAGSVLATDGKSCVCDRNSCTAAQNQQCVNDACTCRDSFVMGGDGECVSDEICFQCEHKLCAYKNGAFVCDCRIGYKVSDRDPTRCQPHCAGQTCDCIRPPGRRSKHRCVCPDGYTKVTSDERRFVCEDIDECPEENMCDHMCNNTFGSYVCSCWEGYELQGDKCVSTADAVSSTVAVDAVDETQTQ